MPYTQTSLGLFLVLGLLASSLPAAEPLRSSLQVGEKIFATFETELRAAVRPT